MTKSPPGKMARALLPLLEEIQERDRTIARLRNLLYLTWRYIEYNEGTLPHKDIQVEIGETPSDRCKWSP